MTHNVGFAPLYRLHNALHSLGQLPPTDTALLSSFNTFMNGTKRYEVPFCEVFKNLVGGFEKRGPIEYLEKMSSTSLFGIQPTCCNTSHVTFIIMDDQTFSRKLEDFCSKNQSLDAP